MRAPVRMSEEPRVGASCATWPSPAETVAAAAPEAGRWLQREATRAAVVVLAFVGIPAAMAAGAVLVLFALNVAVLLGPLVAVTLTWVAWRANRVQARPGVSSGAPWTE